MELGRHSRRVDLMDLVVKYMFLLMWVDMKDPVKQRCEWQKISMNIRNGAKDLIEELFMGLIILWYT